MTEGKRLNLLLVCSGRLYGAKGGREKVLFDMANEFHRRGHAVTVICCDQFEVEESGFEDGVKVLWGGQRQYVAQKINKLINKIEAFSFSSLNRKLKRGELEFRHAAKKISCLVADELKPDVAVSFSPETTGALLKINKWMKGVPVPIITMLHTCPTVNPMLKLFSKDLESAGPIQVLANEYIDLIRDYAGIKNAVYIPNPVPQYRYTADRASKKIVMVGRVDRAKRQHLVAEAFAKIKNKYPDWRVEFWGAISWDKKYTEEVKTLIMKNKLEDQVRLCGTTDNVADELKDASIFAFPSTNEGFGLALCEAMSLGIPAIGWDQCPSVNTIIKNGENGILCDCSVNSLAAALDFLMEKEKRRIELGNAAKKAMENYSPEKVWGCWEDLLYRLSGTV